MNFTHFFIFIQFRKINEKTKTPKIDAQVLKAQNLLVEYYKIEKKNLNYIGTSKDFYIFINKTNNIKYTISYTINQTPYTEQREADFIQRNDQRKISKIMCTSSGCSK